MFKERHIITMHICKHGRGSWLSDVGILLVPLGPASVLAECHLTLQLSSSCYKHSNCSQPWQSSNAFHCVLLKHPSVEVTLWGPHARGRGSRNLFLPVRSSGRSTRPPSLLLMKRQMPASLWNRIANKIITLIQFSRVQAHFLSG